MNFSFNKKILIIFYQLYFLITRNTTLIKIQIIENLNVFHDLWTVHSHDEDGHFGVVSPQSSEVHVVSHLVVPTKWNERARSVGCMGASLGHEAAD